ncbi:TraR/DksA C4-type zinc finger protein [Pseudoalteromonas sp. SSDWG2]|uniref:TraR/DksA C4-type zinc finger protein n=1 Tax=Pseudoalteromonas sp. SSDWG2 TaxID=3139391 RepID=UPI003BABD2C6
MSTETLDFEEQVALQLAQVREELLNRLRYSNVVHDNKLFALLNEHPESDWVAHLRDYSGPNYKELVDKLERLEATQCQFDLGLFGFCSDCEEPIEDTRLEHDVTVQRCQHCESQLKSRAQ